MYQRSRPLDQARQAAASVRALDRGTRLGFQMNVDSPIAAADTAIRPPATSPATGPAMERASHHVARTAPTPAAAMAATTAPGSASDRAAAGARVVVQRAVVEGAARRRRSEQRDRPVAHEAQQDEHVVALVGVPHATRGQPDETDERGDGQERDEGGQLQRALAPRLSASAHEAQAGPAVRAERDRLERCIASGGSGASDRPAARSSARATFTAS